MSLGSPLRLLRAALFAAVCLALSALGHWWMSGQGIPVHALEIAYVAVFAVALALTGRERSFSAIAGAVLLSELALHVYFSSAQSATGTTAAASASAAAAWVAVLICVPGQQGGQLPPGMTVESLLRAAGLDPSLAAHAPAAASSIGSMAMGSHAMAGMSMAGMSMPRMSVPGSGGGGGTGMAMGHGLWGMLAAHVVAGLISAWWLRRGEAAVFATVRVLAMTAFGVVLRLALVLLALASGSRPTAAPVRRARDAWLLPQPGRCALLDVVVRRGPPQPALAA